MCLKVSNLTARDGEVENVEVGANRSIVGGEMCAWDFSNDFIGDEKGEFNDVGVVSGLLLKMRSGFKGDFVDGKDVFVVLLRVLRSIEIRQHDLDLLGSGRACNVDAALAGQPREEVVNGFGHF